MKEHQQLRAEIAALKAEVSALREGIGLLRAALSAQHQPCHCCKPWTTPTTYPVWWTGTTTTGVVTWPGDTTVTN